MPISSDLPRSAPRTTAEGDDTVSLAVRLENGIVSQPEAGDEAARRDARTNTRPTMKRPHHDKACYDDHRNCQALNPAAWWTGRRKVRGWPAARPGRHAWRTQVTQWPRT